MRINTLFEKKIIHFFFLLLFIGVCINSQAQCPTVVNNFQTFCNTESPRISSLVATNNGGGIVWYATPTLGTPLSSTMGLVDGDTYYADDNTGTCVTRPSVLVKVYSAPVGQPFQGVCVDDANDATIADLIAFGNNVKWYNQPLGGMVLPSSTLLIDNTLYYASQTNPNTGCETSRLSVFVNVGVVPVPVGNSEQVFCDDPNNPATVGDIVVSGTDDIFWYATLSSSIPLLKTTPLVNGQSYYATTVDPPCESASRLQVDVKLLKQNNAGTSGQKKICFTELTNYPPFDLYKELTGNPDKTGVWTGPLPTSNGYLGTINVSTLSLAGSPYVFTYKVSSAGCPVSDATVTLEILPPPTVTISSNLNVICSGDEATITFTGTPNATVKYNVDNGSDKTIVLNNAGVASIIQNYNATTTYNLVSITSVGIPSCSQPQTGLVTINVLPLPTVTVNNSEICEGQTTTVIATPSPVGNYTYLWTVPVGVTNPGNVPTFSTTIAGDYSVEITDIVTSCGSAMASGTVKVNPLPTVKVNNAEICEGKTAIITATPSPAGNYTYLWTVPVGVTNPGNVASFSTTIAGNYSVKITSTITTCESAIASGTVKVNPLPTVTVNNAEICKGQTATVTATPFPAGSYNYLWTVPTGVANPGNVATFSTTIAGDYSVEITDIVTGCGSAMASGTVKVNPLPTVKVNNADICEGQTTTITATPSPTGSYTYLWTVPLGVTNPGNAATFSTTIAGDYGVIITDLVTSCESAMASGTVTVNPLPTVTVNNADICEGQTAMLTATPSPAGSYTYLWTVPVGVTNPGNVASFLTTIAGSYSVEISGTVTTCESTIASGTVTEHPAPNAGTAGATNLCSNGDSVDLFTYLGGTPQVGGTWSPVLASGTNIFDPSIDASGDYTYTVLGISPCPNASAIVAVSITPGPNAGTDGNATFCTNSNPEDLYNNLGGNPQIGGTWSPALASGTGVFNPQLDAPGIYTYSFAGTQPCESDSATVTVVINPIPDAGQNGTAFFCTNYPPEDLFLSLGGNPQTGGTWSPALASGTGIFNPKVDLAGVYTYSIGGNLCSTSTAAVTVTVTQSPNAGGYNASLLINTCNSTTSVDLTTALNGTQSNTGTWSDDDNTGALTNNIFNPSIPGTGTYHFTYTVGGGVSPCLFDTATVTVVVSPQPNAGTFTGIQSVCTSVGSFDLFTLLTGYQLGGVWTDSSNITVANPIDISTLAQNTYSYTYTITNSCSVDAETVQLTILQSPVINGAILSASSICLNDSNEVFISGATSLTNGNYTINYNLAGANTIASSANVLFTSGKGSFVIPAAQLSNPGQVTVSIPLIISSTNQCSTVATTIAPITFEVIDIPTPKLEENGGDFCGSDNPTIANLSGNIVGSEPVTWYNAEVGGTAYATTDLLINSTTYYATYTITSGCESTTRLAVTVDLTKCNGIQIPDGFSPNGDGINDEFVIKNVDILYPNFKLEIYNRYGNIIYKGNITTPDWDGNATAGGAKLGSGGVPVGVYFYVLDYNDGITKPTQGRVYLSR